MVVPFNAFSLIEKQPDNARSRFDPVCENFGQCAQRGVQREISLDRRSDPN
jgi:hypothetical protein